MILPNDGRCRMDMPNTSGAEVDYKDWNVYDYPSIGQISDLLRKNDIIPIFSVIESFRGLYDVSIQVH